MNEVAIIPVWQLLLALVACTAWGVFIGYWKGRIEQIKRRKRLSLDQ